MLTKVLKYALPLYIFLLPWQARWLFFEYSLETPFYGGLSLYITDLLFIGITCLWLFWVWKRRTSILPFIKNLPLKAKVLVALAIVFLLYALISVFWFPFDSVAFNGFWKPFESIAFFKWARLLQAYLLFAILFTAPINKRSIFLAVIAGGIWQGLWAIQQFFLQEIPASTYLGVAEQRPENLGVSVVEYEDFRWLRSYGGFPHPNILGAFLSLAALATSAWIFDVYRQIQQFKGRWQDVTVKELQPIRLQVIASFVSFCFILIGLLFSFSRTAWLGFACGWLTLFFSLIYLGKTKYEKKLMIIAGFKQVIAGALILGALTILIGPLWTQRANDTSRLGQQSTTERMQLIEQAQEVIAQQPVQGSGIGSYIVKIREQNPNQDVFMYQPVHNLWLLLWAELGWIGLLPFIGVIAFFLYALKEVARKQIRHLNEVLTISAMVALSIMVYFEHFWWTLLFGSLFAAIWIALFLRITYDRHNTET